MYPVNLETVTVRGIGSTNHKGVDLAAPANSRVLAAAGGTVVNAGYGWGGEGNYVEIDHGNGLHTIYMHMISNPVVKKGQTVKASQVIGYVGMTGAATGYHLHFGRQCKRRLQKSVGLYPQTGWYVMT